MKEYFWVVVFCFQVYSFQSYLENLSIEYIECENGVLSIFTHHNKHIHLMQYNDRRNQDTKLWQTFRAQFF